MAVLNEFGKKEEGSLVLTAGASIDDMRRQVFHCEVVWSCCHILHLYGYNENGVLCDFDVCMECKSQSSIERTMLNELQECLAMLSSLVDPRPLRKEALVLYRNISELGTIHTDSEHDTGSYSGSIAGLKSCSRYIIMLKLGISVMLRYDLTEANCYCQVLSDPSDGRLLITDSSSIRRSVDSTWACFATLSYEGKTRKESRAELRRVRFYDNNVMMTVKYQTSKQHHEDPSSRSLKFPARHS